MNSFDYCFLTFIFLLTVQISPLLGNNEYIPNTFPIYKAQPTQSIEIPISAYNSMPSQTDGDPCIAASGYNLCYHNTENVIATNFLPLGAKVQIPELFGDTTFTVVDRMNSRYYHRADIWMKSYSDAIKFGVKTARVDIL